jgi:hypothetical protein
LDQRQTAPGKYPGKLMQLALRVVGMREAVIYAVKNGECNWLMQNTPDIWEKTGKFLFLSGYLTYVLTDEFTDSVGCTGGISIRSKVSTLIRCKLSNTIRSKVSNQKLKIYQAIENIISG